MTSKNRYHITEKPDIESQLLQAGDEIRTHGSMFSVVALSDYVPSRRHRKRLLRIAIPAKIYRDLFNKLCHSMLQNAKKDNPSLRPSESLMVCILKTHLILLPKTHNVELLSHEIVILYRPQDR